MRPCLALIMMLVCFLAAKAQRASAYFEIKKSQPLEQVLQTIEEDYNLVFSYPDRLAKAVKVAPARWDTRSTDALLNALCEQNNLEYRISDQGDIMLRLQLQPKINDKVPDQWLLRGKVVDQADNGIADVAIYLDTLQLGAFSDEQGNFQFKIPFASRDRKLIFQLIGYQSQKVPVHLLEEQEPIKMQQVSLDLDPVTVTERLPRLQQLQADGGLKWIGLDGIEPGSILGADIFRTIQLLPGVSAHDDLSAAVKIRGSGSDETLLLLDGIPIYKAEHYFGIFSAINSQYVQQTTLYKNALPAAFGGKTGGMLLMESNGELYNRMGGHLNVDLLTSSVVLRAPLGDQVALSLSGRTTYQNAASNPIFDALESESLASSQTIRENFTRPDLLETVPTFQFYDVNARLVYRRNEQSSMDLNYYQSQDDFSNEYENDFRVRLGADRFAQNVEAFSNLEAWSNRGASLNYHYDFSNSWDLKANLYYSQFENEGSVSSTLTRVRPGEDIDLRSFDNFQKNKIADKGAKLLFSRSLAHLRNLEAGLEFIQHQNEFTLQEEDRRMLQNESAAHQTALFSTLPLLNRKQVFIEMGNRLTYYSASNQIYWSPRLNIKYQLQKQGYFKAAFTRSNQFVREFIYNNRLGQSLSFFTLSNEDQFPVGISNNYMLGSHWRLGDWRLDLELYKKDFWGLIEYGRVFPGFDPEEVNPGRLREYAIFNGQGNTHGLDFMLSLEREKYQGWLSYTLSKTTHEFKAIYRGASFPSEDDRRHQLSWVNNYTWGPLSLSATYVMASGRPFLNLAQLQEPRDLRELSPAQLFDRLPAYHRIDLGIRYPFTWKWVDCALGLSVYNVTNRRNVKYQQFVYSIPYQNRDNGMIRNLNQVIGNTTGMLDRTVNLSFSARF